MDIFVFRTQIMETYTVKKNEKKKEVVQKSEAEIRRDNLRSKIRAKRKMRGSGGSSQARQMMVNMTGGNVSEKVMDRIIEEQSKTAKKKKRDVRKQGQKTLSALSTSQLDAMERNLDGSATSEETRKQITAARRIKAEKAAAKPKVNLASTYNSGVRTSARVESKETGSAVEESEPAPVPKKKKRGMKKRKIRVPSMDSFKPPKMFPFTMRNTKLKQFKGDRADASLRLHCLDGTYEMFTMRTVVPYELPDYVVRPESSSERKPHELPPNVKSQLEDDPSAIVLHKRHGYMFNVSDGSYTRFTNVIGDIRDLSGRYKKVREWVTEKIGSNIPVEAFIKELSYIGLMATLGEDGEYEVKMLGPEYEGPKTGDTLTVGVPFFKFTVSGE